MKKIFLLLVVVFSFSSCEKDDICTDGSTPRLVLEFYDISNPSTLKKVVNLKIIAIGANEILGNYNGVSKIQLPLKITDNNTKYSFVLNSTSTTVAPNEDLLQFNYTRKNIYVSRACGFKTVFELNTPNGIIQTDPSTPDGKWMQIINTMTTTISNENETHIKIYF